MASSSNKTRPSRSRKSSSTSTNRPSTALQKTQITINVYDLLPPGRLSYVLWVTGFGLLHSGVAINDREYAYGGHNQRGVTGVYYTRPRFEPPGGTFRTAVVQGFTLHTPAEIDAIVKAVSDTFLGPSYNLLAHNCNHFTSALCERLTNRPAPAWLNRAAGVGVALPCMVPKEWIGPPDVDTADGELLAAGGAGGGNIGDEEDESSERASMMESDRRRRRRDEARRRRRRRRQQQQPPRPHEGSAVGDDDDDGDDSGSDGEGAAWSLAGGKRMTGTDDPPPRLISLTDSSGRDMPVAERAPLPTRSKR